MRLKMKKMYKGKESIFPHESQIENLLLKGWTFEKEEKKEMKTRISQPKNKR